MPDFKYNARDFSGRQVNGVIAASSQQDALGLLAAKQLFPLKLEPVVPVAKQESWRGQRIGARQLGILYSQLADLLKSGVPLLRSLELLSRQSSTPAVKSILDDVREQIADGTRLYDAMRRHPRVFNELVVSMVRAGEEGGFLEEVLKRVAIFTDHQEDLKGKVIGAAVYPLFLTTFGSIVVSILLVYFVPKFEPIFARMKERGDLPWSTTALLGMSNIAQKYWLVVLIALAASIYGIMRYIDSDDGRKVIDSLKIKLPGIGRIVRSLALARFCRVLGTLLHNGVPILQSLKIAKDATANAVLSKAIGDAADNVSEGKSLAQPLAASGQFPEQIVEMISVGEEANNLENVLIDISENLERRTNRELDLTVRMLEPIMLLVMAAVVLFVVAGLLLPIMQSSSIA